jgi:hypothetical protein
MDSLTNILSRSPSPTHSASELPPVMSSTGKHFHWNCVHLLSRHVLNLNQRELVKLAVKFWKMMIYSNKSSKSST